MNEDRADQIREWIQDMLDRQVIVNKIDPENPEQIDKMYEAILNADGDITVSFQPPFPENSPWVNLGEVLTVELIQTRARIFEKGFEVIANIPTTRR